MTVMTIWLTTTSLFAKEIVLPEQSGICPSSQIAYLSNITTHTIMDGTGTITPGWDSDKYAFTPGTAGIVKITYSTPSPLASMKIDNVCNGSGIYRKEEAKVHDIPPFHVNADETIHIGMWDWDSGNGYPFNLKIEFTPDNPGTTDETDENNTTDQTSDNNTTQTANDTVVYEDAEDGNTDGWVNLTSEPGNVSNIQLDNGNKVIKLTGSTTGQARAAYTFGQNWNDTDKFIAQWDMKTTDDYEIFFVSKSSDDPTIVNYIGYVNKTPILSDDYSFNKDTGYWSYQGNIQYDWGRYTYTVLEQNTSTMTTITRDIAQDASDTLGISLTSIEYMHVNVYGNQTATLLLDNIMLKKEMETPVTNHAPVSRDMNITTPADANVTITLTANDADDDNLTFTVVQQPEHGVLSGTAPDLIYTPAQDYNGTDFFTYTANDGTIDSNISTVNITVIANNPLPENNNTAPVAHDQNVTLNEDTNISITLNATDADDDNLTYIIVQQPAHGSISGTAPNLTYTPDADYNSTDSFTFKVNDGTTDSNIATVNITVNDVAEPNTQETIQESEDENDTSLQTWNSIQVETGKTTVISGKIDSPWDLDRYSFDASGMDKIKITLNYDQNRHSEVYVIKNFTHLLLPDQETGEYSLGNDPFTILTVVVLADNNSTQVQNYTLTIEPVSDNN